MQRPEQSQHRQARREAVRLLGGDGWTPLLSVHLHRAEQSFSASLSGPTGTVTSVKPMFSLVKWGKFGGHGTTPGRPGGGRRRIASETAGGFEGRKAIPPHDHPATLASTGAGVTGCPGIRDRMSTERAPRTAPARSRPPAHPPRDTGASSCGCSRSPRRYAERPSPSGSAKGNRALRTADTARKEAR